MEHNQLKEKVQNFEDRFRRDILRADGIREYEKESWGDTKELLENILSEKLGANKIQIESSH